MAVITGLQINKNKNRVNVFIDGDLSLTLSKEVVLKAGLRKSQKLSEKDLANLQQADSTQRCFDAALHFLSYRPRSEFEIKQRLRRRGFEPDTITEVISLLYKNNILDDMAFAAYWKNSRESSNPRSKSIIKNELLRKGVSKEIVNEIIGDVNDEEGAYKAGKKKLKALGDKPYEEFRNRLYNYLKWRGFSYDVVSKTMDRLWKELEALSIK
jgi:regulatory protein